MSHVNLPEGELGSAQIKHFTVEETNFTAMRLMLEGRGTKPGEYTALLINGNLWMSDTDAEWSDHLTAIWQIQIRGGRVLINGLGLGMVVGAALACENVTHVDVVESNPDVAALVGPHYTSDPRCTVHLADAYEIQWPPNTRWDVVWNDIWVDLDEDNLPGMHRLHRKYGRRAGWQGSWGRELIEYERRRTANAFWRD